MQKGQAIQMFLTPEDLQKGMKYLQSLNIILRIIRYKSYLN